MSELESLNQGCNKRNKAVHPPLGTATRTRWQSVANVARFAAMQQHAHAESLNT